MRRLIGTSCTTGRRVHDPPLSADPKRRRTVNNKVLYLTDPALSNPTTGRSTPMAAPAYCLDARDLARSSSRVGRTPSSPSSNWEPPRGRRSWTWSGSDPKTMRRPSPPPNCAPWPSGSSQPASGHPATRTSRSSWTRVTTSPAWPGSCGIFLSSWSGGTGGRVRTTQVGSAVPPLSGAVRRDRARPLWHMAGVLLDRLSRPVPALICGAAEGIRG